MIQEKHVNHPLLPEQKQEYRLKRIQQIKKYTFSELKELDCQELDELLKEAEELSLTKQCKEIQQAIIHQDDVITRWLREQEFYQGKSTQELEQLILQYESFSDPMLKGPIDAMRFMIFQAKNKQQKIKKQNSLLQFLGKTFWSPFRKAASPSNFSQKENQKQDLRQHEGQKEKNMAKEKQQ